MSVEGTCEYTSVEGTCEYVSVEGICEYTSVEGRRQPEDMNTKKGVMPQGLHCVSYHMLGVYLRRSKEYVTAEE